jgi:exosortase A-associated hydrolase 1
MRQILSFSCEGATCAATLDAASGTTGLFIVSGGNEVRSGSHCGMAKLAADMAHLDYPVFRFDRRGVGDSAGVNLGFAASHADMAAALAAFRAEQPQLTRIVAFGNCDAATALMLHRPQDIDALVLTNPWVVEAVADEPSPASARAYYAARMRDPRAWLNVLRGRVNILKSADSLTSAAVASKTSPLAARVAAAMAAHPVPAHILLAVHDGTAIAFADQWAGQIFDSIREQIRVQLISSASHSFASSHDYALLREAILCALEAV